MMTSHDLPTMALRVSDLDATRRFCVDVLGFGGGDTTDSPELAAVLDPDGDLLLLAGPDAPDLTPHLAARHAVFDAGETLVFRSTDLDAFRDRIVARGAQSAVLTTTSWGDSTLAVALPDGYQFKFTHQADLSDEQVLELYARGPELLDTALLGCTEADMEVRDHLGWTVRMLVHHICDGDVLWSGALFAGLVEPGTTYTHDWYTTDAHCAKQLHYESRDTTTAVQLFRSSRAHQVQLLRDVPDALTRGIELQRRYEGTSSPMAVKEMLRRRAVHSLEHIDEVVRLLAR